MSGITSYLESPWHHQMFCDKPYLEHPLPPIGREKAVPTPLGAGLSKVGMLWDGLTVVAATMLATVFELHIGLIPGAKHFWKGTLIPGGSFGLLMTLLCGFILALLFISHRLSLYSPHRIHSSLHEQRLAVQACLTAGLMLTASIYLLHAPEIPRSIVIITIALVTASVSIRRMLFRYLQYRRFDRGVGIRHILIVGTGPEAHALRRHVETVRHLGYAFKGFVEVPGPGSSLYPHRARRCSRRPRVPLRLRAKTFR